MGLDVLVHPLVQRFLVDDALLCAVLRGLGQGGGVQRRQQEQRQQQGKKPMQNSFHSGYLVE